MSWWKQAEDFAELRRATKFDFATIAGKMVQFSAKYPDGMLEKDVAAELNITDPELTHQLHGALADICQRENVCPLAFLTCVSTLLHGTAQEQNDLIFKIWDYDTENPGTLSPQLLTHIVTIAVRLGRYKESALDVAKSIPPPITKDKFNACMVLLGDHEHQGKLAGSPTTELPAVPSPPTWLNLAIGTVSGCISIMCNHPFDTMKTRAQLKLPPTFDLRVLYRGVTAPLCSSAAKVGLGFTTKDIIAKMLNKTPEGEKMPLTTLTLIGILSGICVAPVITPVELIKVRQQAGRAGDATKPIGALEVLRDVLKSQGPQGLFKGMGITTVRLCLGWGFYFSPYEGFKRLLDPEFGPAYSLGVGKGSREKKAPAASTVLIAGGGAGCVAWGASLPFDACKTAVQNGNAGCTRSAFTAIYQQKGAAGFFIGFGPCMVRAFVANASLFFAYDRISSLVTRFRAAGTLPLNVDVQNKCRGNLSMFTV